MNDDTPIALRPIPTCPSKPCYDTMLNVLGSQFKNMDIVKLKYNFNRSECKTTKKLIYIFIIVCLHLKINIILGDIEK